MSDLSELLWDTYAHWKCADHGKTLDEHVREALAESGLAIVPADELKRLRDTEAAALKLFTVPVAPTE